MSDLKRTMMLIAALSAIAIPSVSAHRDDHQKQRQDRVKALSKKQRVREQIRARRAAKGGKP